MRQYETNTIVGAPYGRCHTRNRGTKNEYKEGAYTFHHGVVLFYAEPTFATFSFVINGREYCLAQSKLDGIPTDRQLIFRAGRFGRKIVDMLLKKNAVRHQEIMRAWSGME